MTSGGREHGRVAGLIRRSPVVACLGLALVLAGATVAKAPADGPAEEGRRAVTARAMPEGREWMVKNLAREADGSVCYAGAEINCRLYGRLYTLAGARRACADLGGGWRLPGEADWRRLEASVGGGTTTAAGRKAYQALVAAGPSGFEAVHGGRREDGGGYVGLGDRGFYWVDTPGTPGKASYYEFRRDGARFGRHEDGDPKMALSVRCIRAPSSDAR